MKTKTCLTTAFLGATFIAVVVWANSGGAPAGYSGAPGEPTCTAVGCHDDKPNFPATNHLTLTGIPALFNPGQAYNATVTLAANGPRSWGFELCVKDTTQAEAGTLTLTDLINTRIRTAITGQDYLVQTATGKYVGQAGPVSWSFRWTAPSVGQSRCFFYIAGLACDNLGNKPGDSCFVLSFTSNSILTGIADITKSLPRNFDLGQNYPNPFNAGTTIPLTLPRNGSKYELSIYNLTGQKVRTFSGPAAGPSSVYWDGRDAEGQSVASGIYLYSLILNGQRLSQTMILLK